MINFHLDKFRDHGKIAVSFHFHKQQDQEDLDYWTLDLTSSLVRHRGGEVNILNLLFISSKPHCCTCQQKVNSVPKRLYWIFFIRDDGKLFAKLTLDSLTWFCFNFGTLVFSTFLKGLQPVMFHLQQACFSFLNTSSLWKWTRHQLFHLPKVCDNTTLPKLKI